MLTIRPAARDRSVPWERKVARFVALTNADPDHTLTDDQIVERIGVDRRNAREMSLLRGMIESWDWTRPRSECDARRRDDLTVDWRLEVLAIVIFVAGCIALGLIAPHLAAIGRAVAP